MVLETIKYTNDMNDTDFIIKSKWYKIFLKASGETSSYTVEYGIFAMASDIGGGLGIFLGLNLLKYGILEII